MIGLIKYLNIINIYLWKNKINVETYFAVFVGAYEESCIGKDQPQVYRY